jgi:predicted nucleotidyltransferase component of viral defense system
VKGLSTPFYLTGGTALGRCYFNHRYSDDLDLFVNNHPAYAGMVENIFRACVDAEKRGQFTIDYKRQRRSEHYFQMFLLKQEGADEVDLKIELVNDTAPHYGEFHMHPSLGKVDSLRNILSNKISALFRFEPKDMVDVWTIVKNISFNWQDIVEEAKTKETGVDPIAVYEIMRSFPVATLSTIKWCKPVDAALFVKDISVIAENILRGTDNDLSNRP